MPEITNDILLERLTTLMCDNKTEHGEIKAILIDYGNRIRVLEDWKLVFVAKYSAYSAVALFLGSLVAQVGMQLLSKYI
jgi:hypothetical protein